VTELRPPRRDDAAAVSEAGARFGISDETAQDIEAWFANPVMNMERDARVAVRDGAIAGYADVSDRTGEGKILWIDIRADEDALGALLDFAERRVVDLATPGGKAKAWSPEQNAVWRSLLESRGFVFNSYSRRMRIELASGLPAPVWPDGIRVRSYRRAEDEQAVYEAHQEAFSEEQDFEQDPFDEWVHWSYREPFDPELWFVAEEGDEIAGIALCRPERGGDMSLGWINILGVRKPWRRRGLGMALLHHAFRELQARGKTHAGLGVDGRNEDALALYGRAGMDVERSFMWYEKTL
jgi:mycothiol synthase